MTPEEKLNQAESTAKKALEEVAEARRMLEKSRPWRPKIVEGFYHVVNDGLEWRVRHMFHNPTGSETLIRIGNCYRTEQEAEGVATQRNFIIDRISAGGLAPHVGGFNFYLDRDGKLNYHYSVWPTVERKFSEAELCKTFIEKWGGEPAVVARLQRGWV